MKKETMNTREVCEALNLTRYQLYDLRRAGHIAPCRRTSPRGPMEFRRADVQRLKTRMETEFVGQPFPQTDDAA